MPKVINQTGVSVDSLQAKLTLLESQFTKLSSEHKVVLDSLRSLDKTLQKADIATTFYDTHLATYTAIFGFFLAIVALASWGWIYNRFNSQEKKISTIEGETIPKSIESLKDSLNDHRAEIDKKSTAIRHQANVSLSWGLKSLIMLFQNKNDYAGAVLFMFRYIEFVLDANVIPTKQDMRTYEEMINGISKNLYTSGFKEQIYKHHKKELDEIYRKMKDSNVEILQKFYFSELLSYLADDNQPTTALEADPQAAEQAEQSQE